MRNTLRITIKKPYERAVKKSISLPEILLDNGMIRMRERGLTQLSDYVQTLMRADVQSRNERG